MLYLTQTIYSGVICLLATLRASPDTVPVVWRETWIASPTYDRAAVGTAEWVCRTEHHRVKPGLLLLKQIVFKGKLAKGFCQLARSISGKVELVDQQSINLWFKFLLAFPDSPRLFPYPSLALLVFLFYFYVSRSRSPLYSVTVVVMVVVGGGGGGGGFNG